MAFVKDHNDAELLASTGTGRDINRHYYSAAEVGTELQRPVVQQLLHLIRLRNTHPAFNGRFALLSSDDWHLALRWEAEDGAFAELQVDLQTLVHSIAVG